MHIARSAAACLQSVHCDNECGCVVFWGLPCGAGVLRCFACLCCVCSRLFVSVVGLVCHLCISLAIWEVCPLICAVGLARGALDREVVYHVSRDVQSQASCRVVVAVIAYRVMVMLMWTAAWLHLHAGVYCETWGGI